MKKYWDTQIQRACDTLSISLPLPLSFYLYFYLSTFLSLSGRTCHTLWNFSDCWVSSRKAWLTRYSVLYPPPVTTVTSSNLQSTCPRALFTRKCLNIHMYQKLHVNMYFMIIFFRKKLNTAILLKYIKLWFLNYTGKYMLKQIIMPKA